MIQKPTIPELDDESLRQHCDVYKSLLAINLKAKASIVPAAQTVFDAECGIHVLRWQQIASDCETEINKRRLKLDQ